MGEAGREVNHEGACRSDCSRWDDLRLVLILLAVSGAIRFWLIAHTEVTARDGVGFIRYAWQLQTQSWPAALRENPHPPLYPLTILGMSYPLHWIVHGNDAALMQLSAQLASALAGMLLVVPMYFVGRALFDRRVGFWAALLFQCLPAGSRVLSDALSEGVFLLLISTALFLAIGAFRQLDIRRFALIGVCGGLAYLDRPEGTVILLSAGTLLAARQLIAATRQPWSLFLRCGIGLLAPAILLGAPYAITIRHFTNKTTGINVLQSARATPAQAPARSETTRPSSANDTGGRFPLLASTWAVFWGKSNKDLDFWKRQWWCLASLGTEFARCFHYWAWLPAVWAVYWHWDRLKNVPGVWFAVLLVALDFLILWRVAYVAGYVADRHGLLLVLAAMPLVAAGAIELARRIAARIAPHEPRGWWSREPVLVTTFLIGVAVCNLPKTLEPMHTNRAGYHAAGLWLAANARPEDRIMDPFCWTEFYAGQVFRRPSYNYDQSHRPRFVVLGGSKNEHERLPLIPYATALAKQGTLVYHWQPKAARQKAEEVLVYQVPSEIETH